MPKICYLPYRPQKKTRKILEQVKEIAEEYAEQDLDLTKRQVFYQFVSRGLGPNTAKFLGSLYRAIKLALLGGMIDWYHIVDRSRNLVKPSHWESPKELVEIAARTFRLDRWKGQEYRPEIWVEKDALVGVIEEVCEELDVPYFACNGDPSDTEVWAAAQRCRYWGVEGYQPIVFSLVDHDPRGNNMTKNLTYKMDLFQSGAEVKRLALNLDQVEYHNLLPNPVKETDNLYEEYCEEFGPECWELDALPTDVLVELIREAVEGIRDEKTWKKVIRKEKRMRKQLKEIADNL